jgi:hypothetical protein
MKILICKFQSFGKFGVNEIFFAADFKVIKVRSIMHLLPKGILKGSRYVEISEDYRKIRKSLNRVVKKG